MHLFAPQCDNHVSPDLGRSVFAVFAQLFAAALLASTAGCREEVVSVPEGQGSARDTLVKAHHALLTGSQSDFVDCYTGKKGYKKLMANVFEYGQTGYAFQDRLAVIYGPNAWREFVDADVEQGFEPVLPPRTEGGYDPEIFEVSDDTVISTDFAFQIEIEVVRVDGVWRIHVSECCDLAKPTRMYRDMKRILEVGMEAMGKDGVSVVDIKKKMGEIFFAHMQKWT